MRVRRGQLSSLYACAIQVWSFCAFAHVEPLLIKMTVLNLMVFTQTTKFFWSRVVLLLSSQLFLLGYYLSDPFCTMYCACYPSGVSSKCLLAISLSRFVTNT